MGRQQPRRRYDQTTNNDRSGRSARQPKTKTRTKTATGAQTPRADKDDRQEAKQFGRGGRLDDGRIERLPSNSPTMAIAPSDYEHIYHDDPHANAAIQPRTPSTPPPPASPPAPPPVPTRLTVPLTNTRNEISYRRGQQSPLIEQADDSNNYDAPTTPGHVANEEPVRVSPDGYTLLGHTPSHGRKVALPPYVVRANNQFSRAVLSRVARYLISRSDR